MTTLLATYQAVARLAEAQLLALEVEDLEAFWQRSDERDDAFNALQALEPQVPGLAAADKQAIAKLIPLILTADERIASHLARMSDETKTELAKLHTGLNALNSYSVERQREALFIDRPS